MQRFFLKAVQHGWVAGVEGIDIPDVPGFKQNVFKEGDFIFEERHGIIGPLSSPNFLGTIRISFRGEEVWKMKYSGRYDERTIPFLRGALMENYQDGLFVGGRGPDRYRSDDHPEYAYENTAFLGDFERFHGHDKVHSCLVNPHTNGRGSVSQIYSYCNYFGGLVSR